VGTITLIPTVPFGEGADGENLAILRLFVYFRLELVDVIILEMRSAIAQQLDFIPA
jgi:hypothetical protein